MSLYFLMISLYLTFSTTKCEDWHFSGENIALGKPAKQYNGTTGNHPAENAVDGNTGNLSCSHTIASFRDISYWTVTLNGSFILKGVRIYNKDIHYGRLQRFKVIGGNHTGTTLYDDEKAINKLGNETVIDIPINSTTPYTELTILVPAYTNSVGHDGVHTYMVLCEVQVYSAMQGCVQTSNENLTWMINSPGYLNETYGLVSVGATIDFQCKHFNFKLTNTSPVKCLENGSFEGIFPTCREIICDVPDEPNGGKYVQIHQNKYTKGDVISIQCMDGYIPRHLQSRECLDTSSWNGTDTNCTFIKCTYPTSFKNGTLFIINNTILSEGYAKGGDILNITCDGGYIRQSSSTECNYDGTWYPTPQCALILCEEIGAAPGGFFIYSSERIEDTNMYGYGTVANIYCTSNSYIIGGENVTLVCDQNGQWTGNISVCNETLHGEQPPSGSDLSKGIIGGVASGAVLLIAGVGVLSFILIKKRRRNRNKDELSREGIIIHNPNSTIGHSLDKVSNDVIIKLEDVTQADPDIYYDFNSTQDVPETAIQLSYLAYFVINIDLNKDKLCKQFEKLPYGLQKLCNAAIDAKGKNRYRNLYAYDETRVVLDVWNRRTDSDYINACYVYGFHKARAYIASQGPTSEILNDFWRMIWQNNCEKIIMLTNLVENGKIKCEQYWPDSGTEKYGSISVKVTQETTFSNFVIRKLNVSKDKEESRTVTQFHFTAWPDKDVPLFCSALVHFHHKVKEEMKPDEAPMVVHCSAGIGRTGTFIAIDFLYDQARELDYIDVFSCVLSLRQQRVNMVQTKSQFIYVHQALAEMFSLKTSSVASANFDDHYSPLLAREEDGKHRYIDKEFELLDKMTMPCDDDKTAEQKENASKEVDFMPSISQPGLYLFGEYIDATFLPIYKEDLALIIARSPSEQTCEDFWKLIYYQNVHTIVMMNNRSEVQNKDIYWPDTNKDVHYGDYTIRGISSSRRNGHTVLVLMLIQSKQERRLQLIQFGGWKVGNSTPDNAESVLSALDCVEENQRQTGNHPVLVHCMDGRERSGLFCVITSLLDRTKVEQDVAISQVIQEMRARRSNVIPNVSQFQFCHEVVLAFLQRHETYANFTIIEQME